MQIKWYWHFSCLLPCSCYESCYLDPCSHPECIPTRNRCFVLQGFGRLVVLHTCTHSHLGLIITSTTTLLPLYRHTDALTNRHVFVHTQWGKLGSLGGRGVVSAAQVHLASTCWFVSIRSSFIFFCKRLILNSIPYSPNNTRFIKLENWGLLRVKVHSLRVTTYPVLRAA